MICWHLRVIKRYELVNPFADYIRNLHSHLGTHKNLHINRQALSTDNLQTMHFNLANVIEIKKCECRYMLRKAIRFSDRNELRPIIKSTKIIFKLNSLSIENFFECKV